MSSFDMNGAIHFDLSRGCVSISEAGASERTARRALLPVDALSSLCEQVPDATLTDFGHRIGNDVGRRVQERLRDSLPTASVQTIVDHLGGELALMGLGSLRLELWGRALVFALEHSAVLATRGSGPKDATARLIAAVIEGAITRGMSRDAKVLPISRNEDEVRLLLCNAAAREQVQGWLSDGCHYGEALARLNEAGGTA